MPDSTSKELPRAEPVRYAVGFDVWIPQLGELSAVPLFAPTIGRAKRSGETQSSFSCYLSAFARFSAISVVYSCSYRLRI